MKPQPWTLSILLTAVVKSPRCTGGLTWSHFFSVLAKDIILVVNNYNITLAKPSGMARNPEAPLGWRAQRPSDAGEGPGLDLSAPPGLSLQLCSHHQ